MNEIKQLYAGKLFDEKYTGERVPTLFEALTLFKERPELYFGVEIKGDNKKAADAAVEMLREFDVLDNCWFYAWDATIIKYLKQAHSVRTMGYPYFIMANLSSAPDYYDYCDEIGLPGDFLSKDLAAQIFADGKTMRAFCMDDEENVIYAVECGASAITANNPVPLMEYLDKHDLRIRNENRKIKVSDKIEVIADARGNLKFTDAVSSGADKVIIDAKCDDLEDKLKYIAEKNNIKVCIDIKGKDEKYADFVMALIDKTKVIDKAEIYTTHTVMLKYIKKTYGIHTIANPAYFMEEIEDNRDFYDYRDEVFVPYQLISKMFCKKMQKKGLKMIMETKTDKAYLNYIIDFGASSVITKEPKEILRLLNER